MSDSLANGRTLRVLTVVDDLTRVSPTMAVAHSITGERVAQLLDQAAARHGWPRTIVVDNGPEFTSRALDQWAYERGIELHFIQPGKPVQNAYIESFKGRVRDECLNQEWFVTLEQAKQGIESWHIDYNQRRPHTSLGGLTPVEYEQRVASGDEVINAGAQ